MQNKQRSTDTNMHEKVIYLCKKAHLEESTKMNILIT